MKWRIRLIADEHSLTQLSYALRNASASVVFENDEAFLTCEAWETLGYVKVRSHAEFLITVANLVCNDCSISLGILQEIRPDGKHNQFIAVGTIVAHVSVPQATLVGGDRAMSAEDETAELFKIASQDEAVLNVLAIKSNRTRDWNDLYKVYEIIQADVGGLKALSKLSGIAEADIKRFKHTANCPKTLGLQARHGALPTDPPKYPVSKVQAGLYVDRFVKRWLAMKLEGLAVR